MKYIFERAMQMIRWNKWISILMVIEIIVGSSVFTYSLNLHYSLKKEEKRIDIQERNLILEITGKDSISGESILAMTLDDYLYIQKLTEGKTFCYIAIPQFKISNGEIEEFRLILTTEEQSEFHKIFPSENLKFVSIEEMEKYKDEIAPAYIHMEWKETELGDGESVCREIESYLETLHGDYYDYRIFSPQIELHNNTAKVKESIGAINKVGGLFLCIFFVGMISVYQIIFHNRREMYGICQACGATNRQLFQEVLSEVMFLNITGMLIGILMAMAATKYLDFGIMIGDVCVENSLYSVLTVAIVCGVMIISITLMLYRKIRNRQVVELWQ